MEIAGSSRITLNDILVGDVWFCSGQSNMVHQLNIHDVTYAGEIKEANYPQIRQFWIPTRTNLQALHRTFRRISGKPLWAKMSGRFRQ